MSMIIHFANMVFKPIINLGAAPMMMIVLTLIALCFKVKLSKALEGGIKLAIALTAIGSVIGVLTTQFQDALNAFVKSTGINLSVTDVCRSSWHHGRRKSDDDDAHELHDEPGYHGVQQDF